MATVIMNSQHSLLPEQVSLLKELYGEWKVLSVPEEGWTLPQIEELVDALCSLGASICVLSPVPALLGMLAARAYVFRMSIVVFHNDLRLKKEVPDGNGGVRIISTVATEGWQLVRVA
jgi:hypothetical protein